MVKSDYMVVTNKEVETGGTGYVSRLSLVGLLYSGHQWEHVIHVVDVAIAIYCIDAQRDAGGCARIFVLYMFRVTM